MDLIINKRVLLPSRASNDRSDPKSLRAIGWSGPKTSPDASCKYKFDYF